MLKNNYFEMLEQHSVVFFNFLKEKYPVFINSNIFYRDIQFGIKAFFDKKDIHLTYAQTENLTNQITIFYEKKRVLEKLNKNTWKVNYFEENNVDNLSNSNLKEPLIEDNKQ